MDATGQKQVIAIYKYQRLGEEVFSSCYQALHKLALKVCKMFEPMFPSNRKIRIGIFESLAMNLDMSYIIVKFDDICLVFQRI